MTEEPRISILLPVFNGGRYLGEQLRSLLAQTHGNWICLLRDDGSTDNSAQIINQHVAADPGRFAVVENPPGNIGIIASINALLKSVTSPYFAYCDQDDVWDSSKLARGLDAIRQVEDDRQSPALVVSDLTVVDSRLGQLNTSFWALTHNSRYVADLRCLPVFNAFPGCTMLGNYWLLKLIFPIPRCAPMHDYWTALVARYTATIVILYEPLLMYRQHDDNVLGVTAIGPLSERIVKRLCNIRGFLEQGRNLRQTRTALLHTLEGRMDHLRRQTEFEDALAAEEGNWFKRLTFLIRNRLPLTKTFVYWLS